MSEKPLVHQLQIMATDPSIDVSSLSSKALLIASKLKQSETIAWLNKEIYGYTDTNLPAYRIVSGTLMYKNPYHGLQPIMFSDSKSNDALSKIGIQDSISAIICQIKDPKDGMLISYVNSEIAKYINDNIDFPVPIAPLIQFTSGKFEHIVSSVRNRILEWSLELENRGILGNDIEFDISEREKAQAMTQNNFYGNIQGIVGDVSKSNVQQNFSGMVLKGDIDSLFDVLRRHDISESDLQELKCAIDSENTIPNRTLGKNVSDWIGKMVGKAISGGWSVAQNVAVVLLTESIKKYYGIA